LNRKKFLSQKWSPYPALPTGPGWEFGTWQNFAGSVPFADSVRLEGEGWTEGELYSLLFAGDHVGLLKSETGQVTEMTLLAPSQSEEESPVELKDHFDEFRLFLSSVRRFFWGRGFLETPTPSLVVCPGTEPHLKAYSVEGGRYLPTSPEIHLKKRLCLGDQRIFELRPCFRMDPKSSTHRKEFFMLEWYRAYEPLSSLKTDFLDLIAHLKKEGFWSQALKAHSKSFRDLFEESFQFQLQAQSSREELKALFEERQIYFRSEDSKIDLIHRLLLDHFEPSFEGITFLEDFPPEMAILSRIGSSGFADRFEIYFNQLELANAFYEVNDPEVQKSRWAEDLAERRRLGLEELSMDEELLDLMQKKGMPPSSGIALGLDRLFMAGKGLTKISQIGF